jgi:hypothetical protein
MTLSFIKLGRVKPITELLSSIIFAIAWLMLPNAKSSILLKLHTPATA